MSLPESIQAHYEIQQETAQLKAAWKQMQTLCLSHFSRENARNSEV